MTELAISLDTHSKIPLYQQIYDYIREEIRRRQILPGERLPSSRSLSSYLQVSRSTVELAYEQLVSEGYLESIPYRGYFACEMEELYHIEGMQRESEVVREERKAEYRWDFAVSGIEPGGFPHNAWKKISKDVLNHADPELFQLGDSQGEYGLREAIANYLHHARGVNCRPSQIIVGAGNDYLLMLLSVIFGEKKKIAMENPTYQSAFRCFQSLGHTICPVPLDEAGMDRKALEASGAQIAYVMPAHQFPMGTVMPLKRRMALLAWAAREEGRYLLEDDYDSEFRYKGKPIPALQGFDQGQRVIYLGTFSRAIAPSIRVSYMVLPEHLLEQYQECCGFYACTVPNLMQQAICQFMQEGYFEKNLNRMRAIYKSKHDYMLAELKKYSWVREIMGENSGLHLLVEVDTDCSEQDVIEACAEQQIRVYGLSEYYISQNPKREYPILLLGYGGLTEGQIADGLQMIDGILAELKKYQPISVHKE